MTRYLGSHQYRSRLTTDNVVRNFPKKYFRIEEINDKNVNIKVVTRTRRCTTKNLNDMRISELSDLLNIYV